MTRWQFTKRFSYYLFREALFPAIMATFSLYSLIKIFHNYLQANLKLYQALNFGSRQSGSFQHVYEQAQRHYHEELNKVLLYASTLSFFAFAMGLGFYQAHIQTERDEEEEERRTSPVDPVDLLAADLLRNMSDTFLFFSEQQRHHRRSQTEMLIPHQPVAFRAFSGQGRRLV